MKSACTRRSLLAAGMYVVGAAACTSWHAQSYRGLSSERWLGPARLLAELEGERAFAEGPAVAPDGDVYFTNLRQDRIMRYSPATTALSVFRENSNGANGQKFDAQGRLTICEQSLGRITRTDLASGESVVLCDSYGGARIADVNDLAIDARGRIYFSSRPKNLDAAAGNVSAVYRLDPSGVATRLLARPDVQMPNGLAVSTDQSRLYVIDSNGQAGGCRLLAYRETPGDAVTNCAFARGTSAHTLYVTCGRQLLAMQSATPGP